MKKLAAIAFLLLVMAPISELLAQTRIRFARGRTSTSVSGTLGRYGERTYVLGARYGQFLSANVSSRNGCVKFANVSTSTNYTTDEGNNYLTLMNGCTGITRYTMTVSISRR